MVTPGISRFDVDAPDIESETPLILFSRSAPEVVIPFCMLTTTISISEIPSTKMTGLKIIAIKLEIENIFNAPDHHHDLGLKTCIRINNGDQIINTRSNQILIIFATTNKRSPIVKKKIIKNCKAKERVRVVTVVSIGLLNHL